MTSSYRRPLNVVLHPGSPAATALAAAPAAAPAPRAVIAHGFQPRPDLNLVRRHGRIVTDLVFVNRYLGGAHAWSADDRAAIDAGLEAVMTDPALQDVLQQYYPDPISSRMLPSDVVDGDVPARVDTGFVEGVVKRLHAGGVLGDAQQADTIINVLLPRGTVLEGPTAGEQRRFDTDEEVDSTVGLGGYHQSVHVNGAPVYYAVGVYSADRNGIPFWDEPWKNVVATFYHELNEYRTDPDVGDVTTARSAEALLGFYNDVPRIGGEIGDIPLNLAGRSLEKVMVEVKLADGTPAPLQLMWSNRVAGPENPYQS